MYLPYKQITTVEEVITWYPHDIVVALPVITLGVSNYAILFPEEFAGPH